jgi:hypothetical protein
LTLDYSRLELPHQKFLQIPSLIFQAQEYVLHRFTKSYKPPNRVKEKDDIDEGKGGIKPMMLEHIQSDAERQPD